MPGSGGGAPAASESSQVAGGRRPYWAGLDGLRAIGAAALLAYHLELPGFGGGYVAVPMFFVLSGFLITDILLRVHTRTGTVRIKQFYVGRALRLFPALVLVVAFSVTVASLYPHMWWSRPTLSGVPWVLTYTGNWVRAFGSPETLGILVHTWSLAVEEQYYLVWPLVVGGLLARRMRRSSAAWLLLGLAGLAVLYRNLLFALGADGARVSFALDTAADGLLLGSAIAFAVAARPVWAAPGTWLSRLVVLTGVAGLAGLVLLVVFPTDSDAVGVYLLRPLGVAAAAAMLVAVSQNSFRWANTVLELPPLRYLGRLSYGLYLWHVPLIIWSAELSLPLPVRAAMLVVVPMLSFHLVEQPVRDWGKRRVMAGAGRRAQAVTPEDAAAVPVPPAADLPVVPGTAVVPTQGYAREGARQSLAESRGD